MADPLFPAVGPDGRLRIEHLPEQLTPENIATTVGRYTGNGFPEGVVAAPPGSVYIDLAMTTGAIQWIKKSGSGTTGWTILTGDTGWRQIALTNTFTGWNLRIRRINNTIYLTQGAPIMFGLWADVPHNTAVNEVAWLIPPGYRVNSHRMVIPVYNQSHEMAGSIFITAVNDPPSRLSIVTKAVLPRALVNGSWATDEQWPSSLPGTPI